MPEINHKDVAAALSGSTVSTAVLEEAIKRVIAKGKQERIEAAQPKEPNWATMTEQDAYKTSTYIPTVEHEVPDYMNIKLKDPEYEVVWASKDQRRIGQLMAEGYEFLIA